MTLPSVVEAAAWLELAQSWDMKTYARLSSMKKNLGLAYMNIVRSKDARFPNNEDIFHNDSKLMVCSTGSTGGRGSLLRTTVGRTGQQPHGNLSGNNSWSLIHQSSNLDTCKSETFMNRL
jgi:hypothetical protein